MSFWTQLVLTLCALALTLALVPTIVALRRAARRAETVLGILEEELRPLVAQAHALTEDVREVAKEAKGEIQRVGVVTERMNDLTVGLARVAGALGGLTRAGQLVGVAAGLKKGVDVFVHRLRKEQGDNHE